MKLSGVIQASSVDVGSKHEHVGYHITTPDGSTAGLYHIGDNPFQGDMLAPYEGCRVEVTGDFDPRKRNLFIVKEVHHIT